MLTAKKVDVWTTTVKDGDGLSRKIEQLATAGADLDFILSRQVHEQPGTSVLYLTPLEGDKQTQTAERLGFRRTQHMHSVQVSGPNEPGIAYRITSALASEGIAARAVSASRLGSQFTMFLSFNSEQEAEQAAARLNRVV